MFLLLGKTRDLVAIDVLRGLYYNIRSDPFRMMVRERSASLSPVPYFGWRKT
ncbi:hypothetical protein S7335_1185 [Synechococcus sp. PCC 7335]|nr:hypothetical protein S7335_1185 [Synechococcus sp. PCC 7335]